MTGAGADEDDDLAVARAGGEGSFVGLEEDAEVRGLAAAHDVGDGGDDGGAPATVPAEGGAGRGRQDVAGAGADRM